MYRYSVTALVLAVSLAACETMPWDRGAKNQTPPVVLLGDNELRDIEGIGAPPAEVVDGLIASPHRRFDDVPLPADLREDFAQTYVYESSRIQIGRMVYYAKASVTELAQFYVNECRKEGWKLESVLRAEGGANLEFRKPGKRLVIVAQAQGVGRSQKLIVHLTPDEE